MAQLERKKIANKGRVKFVSRNIYRQSLINLFTRIAKHSSNLDVQRIAARLRMSNNSRHPVDIKRLASEHEKAEGKILVVVSKVLDDETLFSIPKMKVVCLDISKTAKAKIEKFGGEVYTLDCLFEVSNELKDICLVKGDMTARKCYKYFGACGIKGSKSYPKSGNKGKNREKRIFK